VLGMRSGLLEFLCWVCAQGCWSSCVGYALRAAGVLVFWVQLVGMGAQELRDKFNFPNSAKVKHHYGPKVSNSARSSSDRRVYIGTLVWAPRGIFMDGGLWHTGHYFHFFCFCTSGS